MKKNKLLVAITTTKIYEYNTTAESADVAFDEYNNQSGRRFKLVQSEKSTEIHNFSININSKKEQLK